MRILHVITGLNVGGAEGALYNLLAGGLAARFDCHVLSLSDRGVYGDRMEGLGVGVHALGMRRGLPTPGALRRLRRRVLVIRPEWIQGWMYHGNLAAWLAHRRAPGRPVLSWNVRQCLYCLADEKPATRLVIRANRMLSGAPAAVIYNSGLAREHHEAFGFRAAGGRIIPNGFDVRKLAPDPEAGRAKRAALRLPAQARVVGHVGRFHPVKDHARFVRAAVTIARARDEVHFLLAGRDVTPANRTLIDLVPEDCRPRFHWLGERDDAYDLMRAMDVLCVSSRAEAFPNVLGEAMALGVPCVTTDVGDAARIVGDTGVVVPAGDDDALAGGLADLLDRPAAERASLGRAARARIGDRFSLEAVTAEYAALYGEAKSATGEGDGV